MTAHVDIIDLVAQMKAGEQAVRARHRGAHRVGDRREGRRQGGDPARRHHRRRAGSAAAAPGVRC